MSVLVRPATAGDDVFIGQLGAQMAPVSVASWRPISDDAAAMSFRTLLEFCKTRSGTLMLIAEEDSAQVGFLILLTDVPDEVTKGAQAFIAYMAVAVPFRRQGVGRALIAAAQDAARRRGLPHMSLMVTIENNGARALYAALGFREERLLMSKPIPCAPD